MRKQKKDRKQELKLLREQDQELCEILCMPPHEMDSTTVPSLEELNQLRQRVATLKETKVAHPPVCVPAAQPVLCVPAAQPVRPPGLRVTVSFIV